MDHPILVRIPFSHYSQKAEWGLSVCGIDYLTWDVSLRKMVNLPNYTPTGLVPALIVGDEVIEGSDKILRWADENRASGAPSLYPEPVRAQVEELEAWADNEVGPLARREAYRVAYADPGKFTKRTSIHLVARAAKSVILDILKYYKVRRYDESDAATVPAIFSRVAAARSRSAKSFIFANHPTAADIAIAALARPLQYADPSRNYRVLYGEKGGWPELNQFIDHVRPKELTRLHKRRIRQADLERLGQLTGKIDAVVA